MQQYIPGTNPKWGRNLPEGYNNSLVDSNGENWDNGFNFDEKDDGSEINEFNPEAAKKAREEALRQAHSEQNQ